MMSFSVILYVIPPKNISKMKNSIKTELDGLAVSALRRAITEVKGRWSVIGWVTKIYYLELLRAS
jgi:hypothetical protein